ncbi:MAG: hypothetical protein HQL27_03715 [Candidatus Omnitrophica bacterium]|nr:hypothetical protein [Candidatus Omnitrophota bacterium]
MVILILAIGLYASFLPPHLIQESDAFSYHMTIPRQLLLRGSFEHIGWSFADLYLLPVDFALAPFWFCTKLPNKIPQFVFLLGLILASVSLAGKIGGRLSASGICIMFGILGTHSVGIQIGTAMLDLVLCYLFIAALDSFIEGKVFRSAIEFAFYFWSKPFMPVQAVLIILLLIFSVWLIKRFKCKEIVWNLSSDIEPKGEIKRFILFFLAVSLFVAGPFVYKSMKAAGTPLFPLFTGLVKTSNTQQQINELKAKSDQMLMAKDSYGYGRGIKEFVKHIWLIAVPEKEVNNKFDYPLGLVYLLCLGPFFGTIIKGFRQRKIAILPLIVIVFWTVWWMGSHQSRFLYVPLILMIIIVLSQDEFQSRLMHTGLIIALILTAASVYRANKSDFGKNNYDVLRDKDKILLQMSKAVRKGETVTSVFHDVAFAEFKVDSIDYGSDYVLKQFK